MQNLPSPTRRGTNFNFSSRQGEREVGRTQVLLIKKLKQKIERLRGSSDIDSKTSSKLPSIALLKKPEL
ncbi:hypothetical protein [Nostoc sp. UHCC 0252]|uniref:hypothetical protein n=1 Tax=Nostoc sp. UHCC 0252 TaxID=3110241 RepID=UPI002B1F431C|nr:hypothetical protein [Nostoc sp. UHCC 0252]MEA5602849.1 hypothetical protein [Nostoc sp. UHCC 0252]